MNRGKFVIVAIVGVALAAAIFSTWYHYQGQHRAQDFWGTSTARLIAEGTEIELLVLDADDPTPVDDVPQQTAVAAAQTEAKAAAGAGDRSAAKPEGEGGEAGDEKSQVAWVVFGGFAWQVLGTKDATQAKGMSNLRRALVLDTTFDWQTKSPQEDEPNWRYAMIVNDGRDWATLLFDFDSQRVALTDGRRSARLNSEAAEEFAQFFREQFPNAPAMADEPSTPAEPAAVRPPEEKTE